MTNPLVDDMEDDWDISWLGQVGVNADVSHSSRGAVSAIVA